jgi:hypothetical protein
LLTNCAEFCGAGSKKGAEQNRWSAADDEEDAVEEDIQEVRALYLCVLLSATGSSCCSECTCVRISAAFGGMSRSRFGLPKVAKLRVVLLLIE